MERQSQLGLVPRVELLLDEEGVAEVEEVREVSVEGSTHTPVLHPPQASLAARVRGDCGSSIEVEEKGDDIIGFQIARAAWLENGR